MILPAKMNLFGNNIELQLRACKLWQNQSNKREECYFMEKIEEFGRGCFEQKFIGKKHESTVLMLNLWLCWRGGQFLAGEARQTFSLLIFLHIYIYFCGKYPCWKQFFFKHQKAGFKKYI